MVQYSPNWAWERSTVDRSCIFSDFVSAALRSAKATLASIELVHMIRKGQVRPANEDDITFAAVFVSLAV